VTVIWAKLRRQLVRMMLLTGISQWDASGKPPRYLSGTHLSARVGGLNPRWNQVAVQCCCTRAAAAFCTTAFAHAG
jgi:hypothetical protein